MFRRLNRRRLALSGVLCAVVAATALPASAGASFDPEFSVISHDLRFRETPNGFTGQTELLNPFNTRNRVGRSNVNCRVQAGDRKAHCAVAVHLDGTIGGYGNLFLKGNLGGRDHTLNVVDGTGDFTGAVTGKAVIHNLNRRTSQVDFHLTAKR